MEVKKGYLILGFGLIFFFLWGVALSWEPEAEDQGRSAASPVPMGAVQVSAKHSGIESYR